LNGSYFGLAAAALMLIRYRHLKIAAQPCGADLANQFPTVP
jgi:hypothetical protein